MRESARRDAEETIEEAETRARELARSAEAIWRERRRLIEDMRAVGDQLVAIGEAEGKRFPRFGEEGSDVAELLREPAAGPAADGGKRRLDERGQGGFDPDRGQAVKPDVLDQRHHLRLRAAHQDRPTARAEAASQHGEIDDQRGVGEGQLGQIDGHVRLRAQRSDHRLTAAPLR